MLLLLPAVAVALLVLLIVWLRVHAFLALMLVSLGLGLMAGLPAAAVVRAFQDGFGSTLGFVAVVIGLGAMFGALLAESGGIVSLAARVTAMVGPGRLPWGVALVGFFAGMPVFFSVGLVLLFPVVAALARAAGLPLLTLGLPLVAGLSASHGLVAPHPGPLVAIDRLGADTGRALIYGVVAGLPAVALAGPWFLRALRRIPASPADSAADPPWAARGPAPATDASPGAGETAAVVLLPVLLMLLATLAAALWPEGHPARRAATGLGNPAIALLCGVVVALWRFGTARGLNAARLLAVCEASLGPIAGILLVVGAGGGFGRVLDQAGVGQAIAGAVGNLRLSPLIFGWIVAALLRIAVGSATVAVTTAAALVAPIADATPGVNRELLVVALGAGSLIASHLNDGGFWLVKEYFGLDVPTTLRTWTVMETIISAVALLVVLALSALHV